jgi:signal transduction histidine kinase
METYQIARADYGRASLGDTPRPEESRAQGLSLDENFLNALKIMSHDIRGSLISVSATLKLLSRGYYGKLDSPVAEHLDGVLTRMISLIGVTEECLGIAFSAGGDFEMKGKALDLGQDVLSPVLEELAPELKDRRMLIDRRLMEASAASVRIKANRIWLKMVFRNLLRNAVKYGEAGGTISIGCVREASFCRLNVFNSGNPIPQEFRERLFSKYAWVHCPDAGGTYGLGLGLYLVRKIVESHGGEVWYEARENGSNLVFALPLDTREENR